MKNMNGVPPILEHIEPSYNQSFSFRVFEEAEPNLKPFWHYHPEIELVFVKSGAAKRHIGNHVSYYKNGDLILLGPNLPHYGFTERLSGRRSEIVVQMKRDFLGERFFGLPESKSIEQLFIKAESGIVFHGETKKLIGIKLEEIANQEPFDRMIGILQVFKLLAASEEFEILHTNGPALVYKQQDNDKIERVYSHVKEHFKDTITLEEISDLVSMEVPSFCRYFKRVTGKTFTVFVNDFRVSHACKLLAETNMSVSEICFESGFNNSSHFNRLFKNITGKTPHAYREEVQHVLA
ncbi:MAG: AraC family transcriptional regulator [Saprospiraceae bacterium]